MTLTFNTHLTSLTQLATPPGIYVFFTRAVGIHSNWRMIITHAVMLYIGLQGGLHKYKIASYFTSLQRARD